MLGAEGKQSPIRAVFLMSRTRSRWYLVQFVPTEMFCRRALISAWQRCWEVSAAVVQDEEQVLSRVLFLSVFYSLLMLCKLLLIAVFSWSAFTPQCLSSYTSSCILGQFSCFSGGETEARNPAHACLVTQPPAEEPRLPIQQTRAGGGGNLLRATTSGEDNFKIDKPNGGETAVKA